MFFSDKKKYLMALFSCDVLNGMKQKLSSMDCIQKDRQRTSYYQKFHYLQTLTSKGPAGFVVFVYFASDHTLASSQQIWQEGDTHFSYLPESVPSHLSFALIYSQ